MTIEDQIQNKLQEAESKGNILSVTEQPVTMGDHKRKLDESSVETVAPIVDTTRHDMDSDIVYREVKREKVDDEFPVTGSSVLLQEAESSINLTSGAVKQEDEEEEEFETSNGMVKLLFPFTSNSILSKYGVYVEDVSNQPLNIPFEAVNVNSNVSVELVKKSVKAMRMLQLLKEKSLENSILSKRGKDIPIKEQLKSMLSIQRKCLSDVGLDSFQVSGLSKKGSLLRNAAVVKSVLRFLEGPSSGDNGRNISNPDYTYTSTAQNTQAQYHGYSSSSSTASSSQAHQIANRIPGKLNGVSYQHQQSYQYPMAMGHNINSNGDVRVQTSSTTGTGLSIAQVGNKDKINSMLSALKAKAKRST